MLTTFEYMRNVIEVEPEWMVEVAPHFYKMEDFTKKDQGKKKKLRAEE